MQPTTKIKQPDGSFIAFLKSHYAWPVWIVMSYLIVAFAIVTLATAAGLVFAAMNRPQVVSGSQTSPATLSHDIQHK